MKKLFIPISFTIALFLSLYSCSENANTPTENPSFKLSKLVGVTEKGPFSKDSDVKITGLDTDFNLTNTIIRTKTIDNLGNFDVSNIDLPTKYAQIEVTGSYFSETTSKYTTATLQAITNLENATQANVNILTHLEKKRVEYLLKSGKSFEEAKKIAQTEILNAFNISNSTYKKSELLTLKNSGALVALSILMDISENPSSFWNSVASDIATDGTLDNPEILKTVYNHITAINIETVKQTLKDKLGITLPSFQEYLNTFITNNTPFTISFEVTNVICFGSNDGRIVTTINGNNTPFTFSWSNGEITQNLESVSAGTYTLTVTDSLGYTISKTVEISEPSELIASISITDATTAGNDGIIEVTASGGNGNYIYSINGDTFVSNNVFQGLSAGDYAIITRDSKGCSVLNVITITSP